MLTIEEIDVVCQDSASHLSKAVFPGLHARRHLYIADKVRSLITGQTVIDKKKAARWLVARALLENFVDGKWLTVKSKPKSRAEMAILCPHKDEVWEFRDVRPKPSLRILGSFAAKNVFVALAPYERAELGAKGSVEWTNALGDYKNEWMRLFDGRLPMSGKFPDDYLDLARHLD